MNIISIIPARMGSSRFPDKPMKSILGMPMIGHVYKRVKMNKTLTEVYVATCDKEIFDYVESIGGKAVMTSDSHERCADRCAEAMLKVEDQSKKKCDIMVLVQGDEPLTFPEMIDEALEPMLKDKSVKITNLVADMDTEEEFNNPNEVKVVMNTKNNALYFSREPIPTRVCIARGACSLNSSISFQGSTHAERSLRANMDKRQTNCDPPCSHLSTIPTIT